MNLFQQAELPVPSMAGIYCLVLGTQKKTDKLKSILSNVLLPIEQRNAGESA